MNDRILHLFKMCNYNIYQQEADTLMAKGTTPYRLRLVGADPQDVKYFEEIADGARDRLRRHNLPVPAIREKD